MVGRSADPTTITLRAALTSTHTAPVNAAYWVSMTRMLTAGQDGLVCRWNMTVQQGILSTMLPGLRGPIVPWSEHCGVTRMKSMAVT
ncbi:MAG: hypothetical protein R2932_50370 [Caldilineaceae bacterium]